jgi:O-antigen/teichoic acid export membrane protein
MPEQEWFVKSLIIIVGIVLLGLAIWKIVQARAAENDELNSISKLPASVGNVVARMDPTQQAAFFAEYEKNKKSLVVAYVLWIVFAVYYFYFRKPGLNILLWIAMMIVGIGTIWWIIDLFRMPSIRREYNANVARQALQTLSMGSAFGQQYQQAEKSPYTPSQDPTITES